MFCWLGCRPGPGSGQASGPVSAVGPQPTERAVTTLSTGRVDLAVDDLLGLRVVTLVVAQQPWVGSRPVGRSAGLGPAAARLRGPAAGAGPPAGQREGAGAWSGAGSPRVARSA